MGEGGNVRRGEARVWIGEVGRGFTRVTVVGVSLGGALCDLQVALVGHLVEGGFGAREELAGVAVAEEI